MPPRPASAATRVTRHRLGFAVKVLAQGGLPSHDTRRWQSGPHLRTSLDALRRILDTSTAPACGCTGGVTSSAQRRRSRPTPACHLPQFHDQIAECAEELAAVGALARQRSARLARDLPVYLGAARRPSESRRSASRGVDPAGRQAARADERPGGRNHIIDRKQHQAAGRAHATPTAQTPPAHARPAARARAPARTPHATSSTSSAPRQRDQPARRRQAPPPRGRRARDKQATLRARATSRPDSHSVVLPASVALERERHRTARDRIHERPELGSLSALPMTSTDRSTTSDRPLGRSGEHVQSHARQRSHRRMAPSRAAAPCASAAAARSVPAARCAAADRSFQEQAKTHVARVAARRPPGLTSMMIGGRPKAARRRRPHLSRLRGRGDSPPRAGSACGPHPDRRGVPGDPASPRLGDDGVVGQGR